MKGSDATRLECYPVLTNISQGQASAQSTVFRSLQTRPDEDLQRGITHDIYCLGLHSEEGLQRGITHD